MDNNNQLVIAEGIDGQLEFTDFVYNPQYYVVQSNKLIQSRQYNKAKTHKLICSVITQIKPEDVEFNSYFIPSNKLSVIIDSKNNLFRDINSVVDDLMNHPFEIRDEEKRNFVKIPWTASCNYINGKGLYIQMNPVLKPYLLGLKKCYSQFRFEDIAHMRNICSMRILELVLSFIPVKILPKNGIKVYLTVQQIKDYCCPDLDYTYGKIKQRVIEPAVKEINEKTMYVISYEEKAEAINTKKVAGVIFSFNSKLHKKILEVPEKRNYSHSELVDKFSK